jgi:hypothetical protein
MSNSDSNSALGKTADGVSVPSHMIAGLEDRSSGPDMPAPGFGTYFAKPPSKRKNERGEYDITTPKNLLDWHENYVAVLSTGENRHPEEEQIIDHYARQLIAKKAGTYNPLEDAPVVLYDILPTIFVVVNKVFSFHEITIGGGDKVIKDYVQKLIQAGIDVDILPVQCGKVMVLPLHRNVPAQHRDPLFNAQMQTFYKRHDKGAADMMERIVKAREEGEKKMEEQRKREKEQREQLKIAGSSDASATAEPAPLEEDDGDNDETTPKLSEAQSWADMVDEEGFEEEKTTTTTNGEWKTVAKPNRKGKGTKARRIAGGRRIN